MTKLLPPFKLGDADTTSQVQVKHLVCACTGLPRQDFEWVFEFEDVTPAGALATLGTMQPTSKFGEMFQYSNPLAAAGGFVGGARASTRARAGRRLRRGDADARLRAARDEATTFDLPAALRGNHATPHAPDIDGKPARAVMDVNYAVIPVRPAGARLEQRHATCSSTCRWSSPRASCPTAQRYIPETALLARRAPQVPIGKDAIYGMGLMVDTTYGMPVVHHGGDMIGYHSDMMWLPEHGVGAVVLTNGDPGWLIRAASGASCSRCCSTGSPRPTTTSRRRPRRSSADRRRAQAAHRPGRPGRRREARLALRERRAR